MSKGTTRLHELSIQEVKKKKKAKAKAKESFLIYHEAVNISGKDSPDNVSVLGLGSQLMELVEVFDVFTKLLCCIINIIHVPRYHNKVIYIFSI